jgi:hypothetical protein
MGAVMGAVMGAANRLWGQPSRRTDHRTHAPVLAVDGSPALS